MVGVGEFDARRAGGDLLSLPMTTLPLRDQRLLLRGSNTASVSSRVGCWNDAAHSETPLASNVTIAAVDERYAITSGAEAHTARSFALRAPDLTHSMQKAGRFRPTPPWPKPRSG